MLIQVVVGYTYCYKVENGINKIYISDYIYNEDCPCAADIKAYLLKAIFSSADVMTAFNITQPIVYDNYEVYVANCVQKIPHNPPPEEGYCPYCYQIIECEGSGCCAHSYQVKYRYYCLSNPQDGFTVEWFNEISESTGNETCEEPCFLNCANWSGIEYIPPAGKIQINSIEDFKTEIILQQNNILNLSKLEISKYEDYNLKIFTIDGLMIENLQNINKNNIESKLLSLNLSKGVYLYVISNDELSNKDKGKFLIK